MNLIFFHFGEVIKSKFPTPPPIINPSCTPGSKQVANENLQRTLFARQRGVRVRVQPQVRGPQAVLLEHSQMPLHLRYLFPGKGKLQRD